MPKLQAYKCRGCGQSYEFTHHPSDEPNICPHCGSPDADLELGGRSFSTIVPDYPGAHRRKAGYVHKYVNRPADRPSVSVPRGKGDS